MKTYLISYDLHNPGRDHRSLHEAIIGIAAGYWRHLESVWLINSQQDAAEIRDTVRPHIDPNDEVLVISLGSNWSTFNLSNPGNDWLRSHLHPDRLAA